MPRYRITLEYDGTPFVGWQRQAVGVSVQGAIEHAIRNSPARTSAFAAPAAPIPASMRCGQVAHFDLSKEWTARPRPGRAEFSLSARIPLPCSRAPGGDGFDARFSAIERSYIYRILTRRAPPVLERNRVWWLTRRLDAGAMRDAASVLVGHHDFTTFRATQCQAASPMKTLDVFDVARDGDEIRMHGCGPFVSAQSGALDGRQLEARRRRQVDQAPIWQRAWPLATATACGTVAPASGLYLADVRYPPALQPRR